MRFHFTEILLLVLAVLFSLLGFRFAADPDRDFVLSEPTASGLRVATWNLGVGSDPPRPAQDEYIAAIAADLKQLDPDLVFLQELADQAQSRRLEEMLGGDWRVVMRTGSGVAVAFRRGEVQARRVNGLGRRKALVFSYQSPGKPPVLAANLHADVWSSERRNRLIGRAADHLAATKHAILGGDLNLDVDFRKRGDLFTDDLHRDVESYNYLATRLQDAGINGGSTAEPDRRLDYLFVGRTGFRIVNAGPWRGHRHGAMDHEPLVADLVFK